MTKQTWKKITVTLATLVTLGISAAPAFACGPYHGQDVALLQIEWSAQDVAVTQERLHAAIKASDAAAKDDEVVGRRR